MKVFTVVACLIAIVYAGSLARQKRQAGPQFLLPDGAEFILTSQIDNSYVCSDEGIYADLNNNCEIFHICHITENPEGGADLRQYSFICPNTTIFNQFSMTCDHRSQSLPCEYAPEFFSLNKRVQQGRPDVLLHTDEDVARLETIKSKGK